MSIAVHWEALFTESIYIDVQFTLDKNMYICTGYGSYLVIVNVSTFLWGHISSYMHNKQTKLEVADQYSLIPQRFVP
jgi:hypothetical protein